MSKLVEWKDRMFKDGKFNKENAGAVIQEAGVGAIELAFDGIAGTFLGGAVSIKNTLKQNQINDKLNLAVSTIEERLDKENIKIQDVMTYLAMEEMLLDRIENEVETAKIKLFANQFVTGLMQGEMNVEDYLEYHEVLKRLRLAEIRLLKHVFIERNYVVVESEKGFGRVKYNTENISFHNRVRNKLVTLGIIEETAVGTIIDEDFILSDFGQGLVEYCKLRVENLAEQA
ncbi:hypothetical protein MHB40_03210 [Lysinibacillus sp. FSL K6-0057]|uniref:hypothetical protein n=1 Tax=Lysinibacillus sp. FSL K6-0057 TaxID=2921411 RepID=UPI00315A3209